MSRCHTERGSEPEEAGGLQGKGRAGQGEVWVALVQDREEGQHQRRAEAIGAHARFGRRGTYEQLTLGARRRVESPGRAGVPQGGGGQGWPSGLAGGSGSCRSLIGGTVSAFISGAPFTSLSGKCVLHTSGIRSPR